MKNQSNEKYQAMKKKKEIQMEKEFILQNRITGTLFDLKSD
jgi:hypothetical protein